MKDLLLYIARSLVEHPDQVSVTEVEEGDAARHPALARQDHGSRRRHGCGGEHRDDACKQHARAHIVIDRQHVRPQARIDGLITLTERSIDLLREKRAALITAAVTGKIDVRDAA